MSYKKTDPTVVIGLGGAGSGMVADVRDLIRNEVIKGDKEIDNRFQYIIIDSDDENLDKIDTKADDVSRINIDKGTIESDIARQSIEEEEYHYLPEDSDIEASHLTGKTGTGQRRPVGRYCLHYNQIHGQDSIREKLSQRIEGSIESLMENVGDESVSDNNARIWILNSLSGGTGSGMFIDIAGMVNEIVEGGFEPAPNTITSGDFSIMGVGSLNKWGTGDIKQDYIENGYTALEDIKKTVAGSDGDVKLRIPVNQEDIKVHDYLFDEYFLQPINFDKDYNSTKAPEYRRQRNRVIGSLILSYAISSSTEDIAADFNSDRDYNINWLTGYEVKAPMSGIYMYSSMESAIESGKTQVEKVDKSISAYESDISDISNAMDVSVHGPQGNEDQDIEKKDNDWRARIEDVLANADGDSKVAADSSEISMDTSDWSPHLRKKLDQVIEYARKEISHLGGDSDKEDINEAKKRVVKETRISGADNQNTDDLYYEGGKEEDAIAEYLFLQLAARHIAENLTAHEIYEYLPPEAEWVDELHNTVAGEKLGNKPSYQILGPMRQAEEIGEEFWEYYKENNPRGIGILTSYIGIPFTNLGTGTWKRRKICNRLKAWLQTMYKSEDGEISPTDEKYYSGSLRDYHELYTAYKGIVSDMEESYEKVGSIKKEYNNIIDILERVKNRIETDLDRYESRKEKVEESITSNEVEPFANNRHAASVDLPVNIENIDQNVKKTSRKYFEEYEGVKKAVIRKYNLSEDSIEDLGITKEYDLDLEEGEINPDRYDLGGSVSIDWEFDTANTKRSIYRLYSEFDLFDEIDISQSFNRAMNGVSNFDMSDINDALNPDQTTEKMMLQWEEDNRNLAEDITAGNQPLEDTINKLDYGEILMRDPYRVWMTVAYSGLDELEYMSEYMRIRALYTNMDENDLDIELDLEDDLSDLGLDKKGVSEAFAYPELHAEDNDLLESMLDIHSTNWIEENGV
ncbi:tubulin-like doman-containing protein [Halorutilales archaeon Cl-col2-1]